MLGKSCDVKLYCMDDYDFDQLRRDSMLLVITSTFGNGNPPENGQKFATFLHALKDKSETNISVKGRRPQSFVWRNSTGRMQGRGIATAVDQNNRRSGFLNNLSFAVFGLGSTAYPNFCAFAQYVDNLLGDLGAKRMLHVTEGDELSGQDQAFSKWADTISQLVVDRNEIIIPSENSILRTETTIKEDIMGKETIDPEEGPALVKGDVDDDFDTAMAAFHPGRKVQGYKLVGRKELNSTRDSSCHTPLVYSAGDHVAIFPSNSPQLVTSIMGHLVGLPSPPDSPVQLRSTEDAQSGTNWPRCSLKELLSRYLDLTTPPSISVLEYLLDCTQDEGEKTRLRKLVRDGEAYCRWRDSHWPTLLTALEQFPHAQPNAATLCFLLPKMQPRFYSVSSTPRTRSDELQLTIAVITFDTLNGGKREGVCSNYMNDVALGTTLPCFVRRSPSFHLPEDRSVPLILIGPGTGIAPFKGFCDEMEMGLKKGERFGKWKLYHGCRTRSAALYCEELRRLRKLSTKFNFRVALSREPGQKKTYVQDLLWAECDSVAVSLVEQGAHLYVCGDVNMAEGVAATVKKAIAQKYSMEEERVENFMLMLRDEDRYHEDIFGVLYKATVVAQTAKDTQQSRSLKDRIFSKLRMYG